MTVTVIARDSRDYPCCQIFEMEYYCEGERLLFAIIHGHDRTTLVRVSSQYWKREIAAREGSLFRGNLLGIRHPSQWASKP